MKISIVIPTLNEEEGIGPTLDAVDLATFKQRGWKHEFIVVDGNSTDNTAAEAKKRGARVVTESRRGYGRAYKRGFSEAAGDVIVTGDADGTYPFESVHEVVDYLLEHDLEFITCNRYAQLGEGSMSAKHHIGNWVLTATTRMLFWKKIRDSQSGMWVFRRSCLDVLQVDRLSEGMPFSQEIKVEAFRRLKGRVEEVPSSLRARIGEPVIATWRDGFGNLFALFKHRFRRTPKA